MTLKLYPIPINKLTDEQKRRLRELTFEAGMMKDIIDKGSMTGYNGGESLKIVIGTKDNKIVGWCVTEKNPSWRYSADEDIHLIGVYVDPQYLRQGIGTQLVKKLLKTFPEVRKLEVSPHDQIAYNFYKRFDPNQVSPPSSIYDRRTVDLDKKIKNPKTGRMIKVRSALTYNRSEPVYKLATQQTSRDN